VSLNYDFIFGVVAGTKFIDFRMIVLCHYLKICNLTGKFCFLYLIKQAHRIHSLFQAFSSWLKLNYANVTTNIIVTVINVILSFVVFTICEPENRGKL